MMVQSILNHTSECGVAQLQLAQTGSPFLIATSFYSTIFTILLPRTSSATRKELTQPAMPTQQS